MPLSAQSPNIQNMDLVGRKRNHDEFAGDLAKENHTDTQTSKLSSSQAADGGLPPSHARSDPYPFVGPLGSPPLTEARSCTPLGDLSSPLTPIKFRRDKSTEAAATMEDSTTQVVTPAKTPAIKRKRLTAEEKETRDRELEDKKKEREEQAAKRAAEKARLDEEKAVKAREREGRRKVKEQEERAKVEQRDAKRRKKEEEQQRILEEKNKKARSQPKLNAFFKIPGTSKKADDDKTLIDSRSHDAAEANVERHKTEYEKMFKPFFLRENTRLAKPATQMDEATKSVRLRILDSCVSDQQIDTEQQLKVSNPVELLCLASATSRRGRYHYPVKYIMEAAWSKAGSSRSGGGATAPPQIPEEARRQLATIPQKTIAFSQDVRPPYYGTITLGPHILGQDTMRRLARQPTRPLASLDYEYDSEAEWQDEEGEDVDLDDDEEEVDDEDDMDGFLDDAEDCGLSRRVFGNMEPESTGICFENFQGEGPCSSLHEHEMEFMHEFQDTTSIDPFSNKYWVSEINNNKTRNAQSSVDVVGKMPPPPTPSDAFAALNGDAIQAAGPAKLVKAELLNDVKQAILDNKALSKVGIVDFIFHQFRNRVSRAEVKNTLELVAEKKGAGRSKEWDLKPGHEIASRDQTMFETSTG